MSTFTSVSILLPQAVTSKIYHQEYILLITEAFKCYCGSFFIHSELSPFYGIIRDWCWLLDDAVEQQKLGMNKEWTTVALKGFIWSISNIITTCY